MTIVDLERCKIHQKIFNTEVLIYDEAEGVSDVLKDKVTVAILNALQKIREVGYFPMIKINLYSELPFTYYDFLPTPANLMQIKTLSNFDVGAYEIESDPPVIHILLNQLYNFFLASKKQAILHQDIIKTLKGADQSVIQEIVKQSANEDNFYSAVLQHTLLHEIAHAYQDKRTRLLQIQKRLTARLEIKCSLSMFEAMSKGMEQFVPQLLNTIIEDVEKFRMALQTEGTAEFIAKALNGQPDLKETYNHAVQIVEELNESIHNFFEFSIGLAGEINEKVMNELLDEWKKIEDKMTSAVYPVGLHMVTVLSWKYGIDKIIKLSRFSFMEEYMHLAIEFSEFGLGIGPKILGKPLVSIRGKPAILGLDDIKAKAIEEYEFQKKKLGIQ